MPTQKDQVRVLSFSYKDSGGNVTERSLTHWKETSKYIQGRSEIDDFYRTFRKDRVLKFLLGAEHLVFDQAPPGAATFFRKIANGYQGTNFIYWI